MLQLRQQAIAVVLLVLAAATAVVLVSNSGEPVTPAPFARADWLREGMNAVESSPFGDFRWSDGAARLCVEALGNVERAVLELAVIGDYTRGIGVTTFGLAAGDARAVQLETAPGLRRYQLLSGSVQQQSGRICLQVSSAALPDPNNARQLGVALGAFRVTPLVLSPIMPAPSVLLTSIALALVCGGLLRAVGLSLHSAVAAVLLLTAGVTALLIGGHVPAGPAALRWTLPTLLGGGLPLLGYGLLQLPAVPAWARQWPALTLGWLIVLLATHTAIQWLAAEGGVWPLMAQVAPLPPWWLLPFLLPYLALIAVAVRRLAAPPSAARIALLTYVATLALVVGMELAVEGVAGLTALFADSPYEYIRDTGRVGADPLGFLRDFEQIAPELALHASTHPPGAVLFFWLIERFIGSGPAPAAAITVLISSSAPLAAVWLANELGGRRQALAAALVSATMPGLLTYAVPSLDGVMNALLAFGAAAFLLALHRPPHWHYSLISGGCLAAGLALTYAATQIFFFGIGALLAVGYQQRRAGLAWPELLRRLAVAAVPAALVIVAAAGLTWALSGFNVVHAATTATRINAEMMHRFREVGIPVLPFGPPALDWYLRYAALNLLPFSWYVTPWLLALLTLQLAIARARRWTAPIDLLLAATAALLLGLWLGGLFNREVERIWAFVYPLIGALVGSAIVDDAERPARRLATVTTLGLLSAAAVKLMLNTDW